MILEYMDLEEELSRIMASEIDKEIIKRIRMIGLKSKLHKSRLVRNRTIKINKILKN